jgi:hypothetical protein
MRKWNVGGMIIGRGKPKFLERNLPQCDFICHKFHMNCLGIEPRQLQ